MPEWQIIVKCILLGQNNRKQHISSSQSLEVSARHPLVARLYASGQDLAREHPKDVLQWRRGFACAEALIHNQRTSKERNTSETRVGYAYRIKYTGEVAPRSDLIPL